MRHTVEHTKRLFRDFRKCCRKICQTLWSFDSSSMFFAGLSRCQLMSELPTFPVTQLTGEQIVEFYWFFSHTFHFPFKAQSQKIDTLGTWRWKSMITWVATFCNTRETSHRNKERDLNLVRYTFEMFKVNKIWLTMVVSFFPLLL